MKTLVISGYEIPVWDKKRNKNHSDSIIQMVRDSHEKFCKSRGYDYEYYNDVLIRFKSMLVKKHREAKGETDTYFITDYGRFLTLSSKLSSGYDRVAWLDGDLLLLDNFELEFFDDEFPAFINEQYWSVGLKNTNIRKASPNPATTTIVTVTKSSEKNFNNIVLARCQERYERYLKARISGEKLPDDLVISGRSYYLGTKLLTSLIAEKAPIHLINGVMFISPTMTLAINLGKCSAEAIINTYMRVFNNKINCVHLPIFWSLYSAGRAERLRTVIRNLLTKLEEAS